LKTGTFESCSLFQKLNRITKIIPNRQTLLTRIGKLY
jgi:hypothetical protein